MTILANTHSKPLLPHPSAKCFYSYICLVALFSVPSKLFLVQRKKHNLSVWYIFSLFPFEIWCSIFSQAFWTTASSSQSLLYSHATCFAHHIADRSHSRLWVQGTRPPALTLPGPWAHPAKGQPGLMPLLGGYHCLRVWNSLAIAQQCLPLRSQAQTLHFKHSEKT